MSDGWMRPQRIAASALVVLSVAGVDDAFAQTQLPPVSVDAPHRQSARSQQQPSQRTTRARSGARRATVAPVGAQPQSAQQAASAGGGHERANGPVTGYLARQSSSGTKTSTPIIQTPQSVTVIGAEQIRDQKIVSKFDEVLRYSPGVIGGTYGSDFRNDWFLIRGFPAQNESLFLDGLQLFYTSYGSWKLQPFNLERVEVLRGPSGILYGGSAPGGLVNAVSKMPSAEPIRYIEAGVNNFGNGYTAFDIGGAVPQSGNSQVLYRFVGQAQGGGTQTDYTYDNNFFFAPSVTWRDADTSVTVYATAAHNNTRAENFLPYVGTVTNAPFGKIPTSLFTGDPSADQFRREQETVGYKVEKSLTDSLDFRQNARAAHVDVYYTGLYGLGYATTPAAADLARGNFYARGNALQFNLDNQLEYRFNTGILQHTALLGLDLKHYGIDDRQGFGVGTNLNLLNPVYGTNAPYSGPLYQNAYLSQGMAGLYLQDQVKLDRLTVVLSGRQDWVDLVNQNRMGPDQSREDSKFSGRVGAIYNFDNGVAPYVSYMTGYNPIIGLNAQSQLLLPETSEQTEVGVKYEPVGLNARFSVAYFDLKRKNALTTDPNNSMFQTQNGEVTSRGVELEAVANITRNFKLVASYTNYELFVSKDLNPALIGTVPTNTPRDFASVWTDYTFREGSLAGFGFGGGVRYVGSSFADNLNTARVPSFVLGDLAVHYEWGNNWRAALNIVNVTDKIYVASCAVISSCYYGDRRRFTASLGYKW
ncbi:MULTISPECIES: TonB-dependent siderophore receptor [Bradyrhizobium]|jgi:iron complex outermembrane receptor protein|uniref:TonB-dependent siderophore receptor n=1 Tax=Bradyrhizobium TaxID=374 RepID=UPI0004121A3C|nr:MULTISPECIES: TonB-dependent siderophore receptor [Bradyrhizobium]KIU43060.1 ligand-gated channel [Bradyrhizobium elkanii]MBK5655715.1 TonB-dependent siderophore receptor [Rhizobium sp.]OCX31041.1 ligand-gated channel [Bradyrhizobium sp. UASWS1016]